MWSVRAGGVAFAAAMVACSGGSSSGGAGTADDALHGTIGPQGGELVGKTGSALDGVHLVIPPGALAADTDISIRPASNDTALPVTAVRCGAEFTIEPAGLKLAVPASLSLPFDEGTVTDQNRFDDEVKVWVLNGAMWGQQLQTDSEPGQVTVDLDTLTTAAAGVNPPAASDIVHFSFAPNPKFAQCLAAFPGDASRAPTVTADVVRGDLNDGLFLRGHNIKPGLQFDLFTVENSALLASGTPDPNFKNFGMAWYQSDLEASDRGDMNTSIRTILLDQIFGFDPTVTLPPTGTFEVGFWFNDPQDAVACGFDATKPTPFNGEHQAGPLAMISLPNAATGLGPLCTKPDTSVSPARCDP
ncbi:MAG TPA: hypothetical protein VH044_12360 [Polyangiaceae bacterium]|nr:hypothetical protein [Polyangiaceae bacterium]